jgi:hypothetical protein
MFLYVVNAPYGTWLTHISRIQNSAMLYPKHSFADATIVPLTMQYMTICKTEGRFLFNVRVSSDVVGRRIVFCRLVKGRPAFCFEVVVELQLRQDLGYLHTKRTKTNLTHFAAAGVFTKRYLAAM